MILVSGCSKIKKEEKNNMNYFSAYSKVMDVINHKSFEGFGKLIFPVNQPIDKNMTLEDLEDLSRAVAFIHDNARYLQVDTSNYSVCGGSAGGRMAAWLGNYVTESFGEKKYPRPSAVIMQYTGLSEVTGHEPPTYNCVGDRDSIASFKTMENRINKIKQNGTDFEIEIFEGLPHGFGLGIGTKAEGWINNAIQFWERNMK